MRNEYSKYLYFSVVIRSDVKYYQQSPKAYNHFSQRTCGKIKGLASPRHYE